MIQSFLFWKVDSLHRKLPLDLLDATLKDLRGIGDDNKRLFLLATWIISMNL